MRTLYDLKLQCTFFISCAKSEGLLDSTKTATLKFSNDTPPINTQSVIFGFTVHEENDQQINNF